MYYEEAKPVRTWLLLGTESVNPQYAVVNILLYPH